MHAAACASVNDPPSCCEDSWCYIDPEKCHSSMDLHCPSDFFPGVCHSHSTCGHSALNWLEQETTLATLNATLTVGIPGPWVPVHWKKNASGDEAEKETLDAFDPAAPWRGAMIDYFNAAADVSNLREVRHGHRSGGSRSKNIKSATTQAISDVEAGLVDMVAATSWVRSERLVMAPFTIPIVQDTFKLWIPNTGLTANDNSVSANLQKLSKPFSFELWLSILAATGVHAVLSAVISPTKFREPSERERSKCGNTKESVLILIGAINNSFLGFLSGGVNMGDQPNFPQKCLDFGFALVIFISVTTYAANLAGFLTLSGTANFVKRGVLKMIAN